MWTELQFAKAMFTLYRIVKRSVAESVPDRASVHTSNAAFEAVSAPEQYCSAVESGKCKDKGFRAGQFCLEA